MSEPTPPLDEFLAKYRADDNVWWALDSGDHMNLFDEALDRLEAAEAAVARVRELHSRSEMGNCNGGCTDGIENPIPHDECPTIKALDGTDGGEIRG